MRAVEGLALCGGPDPLVKLVVDDGVFCQHLHHLKGLECSLPLHARLLVKEIVDDFVGRESLRAREGGGGGEWRDGERDSTAITMAQERRGFPSLCGTT